MRHITLSMQCLCGHADGATPQTLGSRSLLRRPGCAVSAYHIMMERGTQTQDFMAVHGRINLITRYIYTNSA
jgi:hypothetical protein